VQATFGRGSGFRKANDLPMFKTLEEYSFDRILVIDDNPSIHEDFRKILVREQAATELDAMALELFGGSTAEPESESYNLDFAIQGADGLQLVIKSIQEGRPYGVCFCDMRMPPGWDGVETSLKLWEIDRDLQIVICTAYSDYSWNEMRSKLGRSDRVVILKKPFDNVEVLQLAASLTSKRRLMRSAFLQSIELNRLVEQKTASLTTMTRDLEASTSKLREQTVELEKQKEIAIAANQHKSLFLANMSHELRTPLTAILGFTSVLSEDKSLTLQSVNDYLQTIQRNGQHLLELINDILDLSKIEADKMTIEKFPCNLDLIIGDVLELLRTQANKKGVALEKEVESLPATILADQTRIRQVILNLMSNAVKFTETGSVRLKVRREGDSLVHFDVRDSGIGLSPKQQKNLFQSFSQADDSMTRRFGGTGLGLAISKRLANMMGGDLTLLHSAPGEGSEFRFTLKIEVATGDAVESSSTSQSKAADSVPIDLKGTRILLAEDGPDNQKLISFVLRKAGATVQVVENGQLAVDAYESAPTNYDLILMDMQMPILDGYSAARTLREHGHKIPIVALTAHAMQSDRAKCIDAGCNDYTTKPIIKDQLLRLIQSYCPSINSTAIVIPNLTPASGGLTLPPA
jgi:two-component system, sensor histidine kinase and response regulator